MDASIISVLLSRLMLSGLIGHSFAFVGVNSALQGVMRTRMSCLFFLSSFNDPALETQWFLELLCLFLSRTIWMHKQLLSSSNSRKET